MDQIEQDYRIIIDALSEADVKISQIRNPQLTSLIASVRNPLNQHINSMSTRIGIKRIGEIEKAMITKGAPLTKIFGRDITQPAVQNNKVSVKEHKEEAKADAEDAELEALRTRIELAYPEFKTKNADQLLDQYDDLLVRAVAKRSGLPVSDNIPKRVDAILIKQIKDAMEKKDKIDKDPKTTENQTPS